MDKADISLQDILTALGGPLEEKALWALLYQAASYLERELRGWCMWIYMICLDSNI